jgi:hypothetical protein
MTVVRAEKGMGLGWTRCVREYSTSVVIGQWLTSTPVNSAMEGAQ